MEFSLTRRNLLIVSVVLILVTVSSIILISQNSPPPTTNGSNNTTKPPGYVMGNPIDIDLKTALNALIIENPKEKVSIRFTAKFSGEVTALVIKAQATLGQPLVHIGLQEDASSTPKGEWMNQYGVGIGETTSDLTFVTANLSRPVSITKGKVYHIVIEMAEANANESVAIITYRANAHARPLNDTDPDVISPDPAMNALYNDGERWREENVWPIFVVKYSDGRIDGQPYSLKAPWVIFNQTYVGQTIIPASNYRIGKIAFVVSQKGNATDKLYYEIRDENDTVLVQGIFAEASQLNYSQRWIEATLSSPVALKSGELYRIVLLSPQTNLENAYRVYGHEFSYNNSLGYGGLRHRLTTSHDGGSIWGDNYDADAVFKLTNTG